MIYIGITETKMTIVAVKRLTKNNGSKSVSWEYSYDDEYLEEFVMGRISTYSLFPTVLPRTRLDPNNV